MVSWSISLGTSILERLTLSVFAAGCVPEIDTGGVEPDKCIPLTITAPDMLIDWISKENPIYNWVELNEGDKNSVTITYENPTYMTESVEVDCDIGSRSCGETLNISGKFDIVFTGDNAKFLNGEARDWVQDTAEDTVSLKVVYGPNRNGFEMEFKHDIAHGFFIAKSLNDNEFFDYFLLDRYGFPALMDAEILGGWVQHYSPNNGAPKEELALGFMDRLQIDVEDCSSVD